MLTLIWPLLIYWLGLFVVCFVVVELGHDQLYDEVTPHAGLKVAGGSLLIAAVLTWLRWMGEPASYASIFTVWTLLQGLVWFGVFTLIFQFHPWHALGLGIATMLLVTGLATMGVDSLLSKSPATPQVQRGTGSGQPVRQSIAPTGGGGAGTSPEPAKSKSP